VCEEELVSSAHFMGLYTKGVGVGAVCLFARVFLGPKETNRHKLDIPLFHFVDRKHFSTSLNLDVYRAKLLSNK